MLLIDNIVDKYYVGPVGIFGWYRVRVRVSNYQCWCQSRKHTICTRRWRLILVEEERVHYFQQRQECLLYVRRMPKESMQYSPTLFSPTHTWMVKVELSAARCDSLRLIQCAVEALLTDDFHATTMMCVRCVLAERRNNLLANCRLSHTRIFTIYLFIHYHYEYSFNNLHSSHYYYHSCYCHHNVNHTFANKPAKPINF